MDYAHIIIAIVAIWGAGLSTYTLIRNIIKEKPRIKVKITFGVLAQGSHLSPRMLFLEANNVGKPAVTLSSCGLRLPKTANQFLLFIPLGSNKRLPCKLSPWENLTVWMKEASIMQNLKSSGFKNAVKVHGFYKDTVGNLYISKPIKLKLNKY
ncbi:hypothetical protein J7M02_00405 [Candidatus Aerophobetes bacterium]|nr:hypothetical protein [Candidatus Aerophobetes bacterium]